MAGFDEKFKSIMFATPAKLSLKNSSLIVQRDDKQDVALPLKDISTIILESQQITITSALLSALAKNKITLLSCDETHGVNGYFAPYLSHFSANAVIKNQIALTNRHKAILWQQIVKAKINNQADILGKINVKVADELKYMSKIVVLNDAKNLEATAAAKYFKTLFGNEFTRDAPIWENSALNYVYAILRSSFVRNIAASGLLGIFGIHHDSIYNNFNLADDLMEAFRPFGDKLVLRLKNKDSDTFLSVKDKTNLAQILSEKISVKKKKFTMETAICICVQSYKNAISSGLCDLELPSGE